MKIGIDISQIVYEGTGVSKYVQHIVKTLLKKFPGNEYVLFGSSLRKRNILNEFVINNNLHVKTVFLSIPPTLLDLLWNKLHIIPVEWFIGNVDLFWSSDWTQPPLSKAIGVTTIHDVSFLKFPETFVERITDVQKRRLRRVKKTCKTIFCDSEATKNDVHEMLGIEHNRLTVVYPGL